MELNRLMFINDIIESADKKDLHNLSAKFRREAIRVDSIYTEQEKGYLTLFSDMTSMMLVPKSINEPFKRFIELECGYRSGMVESLSQDEVVALDCYLEGVDHVGLKARVYDILWVFGKPKNHLHARYAIDSYIRQGIRPDTWLRDGKTN